LKLMTSPQQSDGAVIVVFAGIPALLDRAPELIFGRRNLDCDCLLGPMDRPFHTSMRGGRIIDLTPAPVPMRSRRFAGRTATAIKGASVTIVEQLGRFPMSENPETFRRYITPVLSRILERTVRDNQGVYV